MENDQAGGKKQRRRAVAFKKGKKKRVPPGTTACQVGTTRSGNWFGPNGEGNRPRQGAGAAPRPRSP